jgi:hypothetical protein
MRQIEMPECACPIGIGKNAVDAVARLRSSKGPGFPSRPCRALPSSPVVHDGLAVPTLRPDGLAASIVASWDGTQLQWLIDPSFDMMPAFRHSVRTAVHGVG